MKLEEVNHKTKEAVDFLVAALESGHSEVLTAYLGAMAKFRNYSFGNIMLIAKQKPDATNVAGLRTWNSLGRFVRRGEKGIFILAPMVGNRYNKDASAEQTEDANETQPRLYGFRGVYGFARRGGQCPHVIVMGLGGIFRIFALAVQCVLGDGGLDQTPFAVDKRNTNAQGPEVDSSHDGHQHAPLSRP